ncbi:hypothetical protein FJTKL_04659 [Diaporthe vaccinii]|uniref:Uncharacterized protein n=1 Tax=Diaporthe vaccinii TaxID=105482 RepID=A0ABR4EZI7_9PEZI
MSDGLVDSVKARIEELEALKQSAESVSGSLENLLALKQQQASVVQAWQSVQQAEEALPLAFMSSIFGMNNKEISGPKAPMSLLQQFKLMFPISVGIVVIVLVFAYSGFVRTLVWLAYRYLIIFTLVKTSPYDRIYLSLDWKSASLTRKVEEKVRDMKLLVKKNKKKRTFNEIKEKREKQRAAEIQEEKLQQEEEAKKKRMDHHANGREGQASDASRNPAALVTPTVVATPPAENPRVQFIDPLPPHSRRAGTDSSVQMRDLEAQSGDISSTPPRTLLQVPRTTSHGVQTTPSLIPAEGEWPGILRSERVRRMTESVD